MKKPFCFAADLSSAAITADLPMMNKIKLFYCLFRSIAANVHFLAVSC